MPLYHDSDRVVVIELQGSKLTPLAPHQYGAGSVPCPVVALTAAEQIVPENGCPLSRQQQQELEGEEVEEHVLDSR